MPHSHTHVDNDANDKRFLVHNSKEVAQILADLAKRKMMLNASWNHGKDRVLTYVIEVDYDKGVAYLDTIAAGDAANKGLFAGHSTVFATTSGPRIQWSSPSVSSVSLKDGKAYQIELPVDLIRVQRRECYRLLIPMMKPVTCKIPVEDKDVEVALVDVSVGGIGAAVMDTLDAAFAVGTEFHHCKIDLPSVGTADLALRNKWMRTVMKNDTVKHEIGMEFINPSSANQALIQRYMIKLEREHASMAGDR
ncbi:MAG: flagellar brake protein [Rhodocyclaceae bacterium]|nr:MAG: flagellar brake protein [Rhodocyclaceae bacterium]